MKQWPIALITVFLWVSAAPADAAEIKVLSAGAMKSIVTELAESFRQETGHTVTITAGTAGEIRQKMVSGEWTDVVIVTDSVLEQLATPGLIVADTRAARARQRSSHARRQDRWGAIRGRSCGRWNHIRHYSQAKSITPPMSAATSPAGVSNRCRTAGNRVAPTRS